MKLIPSSICLSHLQSSYAILLIFRWQLQCLGLYCTSSLNSQTKNYNNSSQFLLIMPLKGLQRQILATSEDPWIASICFLCKEYTCLQTSLSQFISKYGRNESNELRPLEDYVVYTRAPFSQYNCNMVNLCYIHQCLCIPSFNLNYMVFKVLLLFLTEWLIMQVAFSGYR